MESCQFNDFLKVLQPWLDRDYIRKVYLAGQDHVTLFYTDGGQHAYRIDDCNRAQLNKILKDIQKRGIPVEVAD